MTLYDFGCRLCGKVFEHRTPASTSDTPIFCPDCGGTAKRLYSSFAIKVHPSYNEAQEIVAEKHKRGEIA